uniref:non-specific serine/threonine protein kinase n=1 Tax=Gossypium raimondii TaxID=29730 RepID=A0A0D2PQG6_GOSRA|nr:hypothetical protein B456_008G073200 [Gossypium raimondii]
MPPEVSFSSGFVLRVGSMRTRFIFLYLAFNFMSPFCFVFNLYISVILVQARFFFQQLISGVSYCHAMQVCHRDLKLENTLLDGSPAPRLKICDFGYSKSSVLHSQPKSTVGTPAYIAPEVLLRKEYDGKIADVWSCGVTLYVMLVGAYPFEDPDEPRDFRKTIQRILSVQYAIPDVVQISPECQHLISRIFVADPSAVSNFCLLQL